MGLKQTAGRNTAQPGPQPPLKASALKAGRTGRCKTGLIETASPLNDRLLPRLMLRDFPRRYGPPYRSFSVNHNLTRFPSWMEIFISA